MTIPSISGGFRNLPPSPQNDAMSALATGQQRKAQENSAAAVAMPRQAPLQPTQTSMTAQAPAGTDPALWSILTGEERAFFAKSNSSGPLTYGKMMPPSRSVTSAAPISIGRRIDVRV